jgi:hypothetical protein
VRHHPAEEERRMRATLGVIATALVFASGCAQTDWIDRTLVTVDVTGSWHGTIGGVGSSMGSSSEMWLDLQQAGSKVTGSVRFKPDQAFGNSGPIEGSVSGDVFQYRLLRGSTYIDLTVSGDEMTGQTSGRPVIFRRVGASTPR